MAETSALATIHSSISIDRSTLSTSIQSCSETEVLPDATELVSVICRMAETNNQTELVTGREIFIALHTSNSELV